MIQNKRELILKITRELKNFTDIAVVGMSGGADSTLVTILSREALGADNVYSLHLPFNDLDEKTFNHLSWKTAEKLGVHRKKIPILSIVQAILNAVEKLEVGETSRMNAGNARSRARMTVLYGVARQLEDSKKKRVRVIGTGNLSEDFIGYDTKGGDALADIFPIGELFKSEVYQLLEYFASQGVITEELINRIPSAGLWEGQTDEEELGYSYDQMEGSVRKILSGDVLTTELDRFVLARHQVHKHKHEGPNVVRVREFCE